MNIAIIGANNIDSMEFHIADALSHANHNVKIFDIYDKIPFTIKKIKPYCLAIDKTFRTYSDKYDLKRFKSLSYKVNTFNPDLVICLYKDIHPDFVKSVKNNNRRVIHLNPDAMTTLGYQQVFAADYDAWFTKDAYMQKIMKENMGLNAFMYKEAFNHRYNPKPLISKEQAEEKTDIDVMTYGTLYPYRTRMMKRLVNAGINIKLYGVVPHRFFDNELKAFCTNEYIVGDKKADILYGSKIVFNNLHFAEIESVNCRFFEASGCGAFQLCDYRPILHELLPIDPELISFRNTNEGIEKINHYLNHPKERHEIAQIIYNHFLQNYTYDHLVEYILKIVNNL